MKDRFFAPEYDTSRTDEESVAALVAGQIPNVTGDGVIGRGVTIEDLALAILTSGNGEQ